MAWYNLLKRKKFIEDDTKDDRMHKGEKRKLDAKMEEELTNEQADHGAPFLVAGYGKVQVSFSERRRGVVLKINGLNIFTEKCTFPTRLILVYTCKSNFSVSTANWC